jgi:hypothetical protein
MRTAGVSLLLLLAVFVGCGSSTSTPSDGSAGAGGSTGAGGSAGGSGTTVITSCDVNNTGVHTCLEYAVGYTPNVPAGCNVLHGTYAMTACDHASSSGGCRQTVATIGTMTTYYYPPIMPADVMVQCANDANATYVAP